MNNLWNVNQAVGVESNKKLGNTNTHPAICKKIVEFVLKDKVITKNTRFLEPAVGVGGFYFAIVDELLKRGFDINYIVNRMIYAYDVDEAVLEKLKGKLYEYGYSPTRGKIFKSDFLLETIDMKFDFIIQNPPYISYKNISPEGMSKIEYIAAVKEVNDIVFDTRSDIYVMFHLKSLNLLTPNGLAVFLCADGWLDSEYGEAIRSKILSDYNMDYIISSQLFPFFRDDTSAIITVISKTGSDTKIGHMLSRVEDSDLSNLEFETMSKHDLGLLFNNPSVLNKRNALVLHKSYAYDSNLTKAAGFTMLGNLIAVESTSLSQAQLLSMDMLSKSSDGVKLFWQIQARVNRKPVYKNYIDESELEYRVVNIPDKFKSNVKTDNVYMSGIIDRFPLLFYTYGDTFHVSKYMSLSSDELSCEEICYSLNNIFSIYSMELDLKEGTRKTLRKGEMGLTKEITRSDLLNVKIVDATKFTKAARIKIGQHFEKIKNTIIYNIEEAVQNSDYMSIQYLIGKELGFDRSATNSIIDKALMMYYFRMRNLEKLGVAQ